MSLYVHTIVTLVQLLWKIKYATHSIRRRCRGEGKTKRDIKGEGGLKKREDIKGKKKKKYQRDMDVKREGEKK